MCHPICPKYICVTSDFKLHKLVLSQSKLAFELLIKALIRCDESIIKESKRYRLFVIDFFY